MSAIDPFAELRAVLDRDFGTHDRLHVCILDYGLTHSRMRILMHAGEYLDSIEVHCQLCEYMQGHFVGGPYRLQYSVLDSEPPPLMEISDAEGHFILRFRILHVHGRWRRRPARE